MHSIRDENLRKTHKISLNFFILLKISIVNMTNVLLTLNLFFFYVSYLFFKYFIYVISGFRVPSLKIP